MSTCCSTSFSAVLLSIEVAVDQWVFISFFFSLFRIGLFDVPILIAKSFTATDSTHSD